MFKNPENFIPEPSGDILHTSVEVSEINTETSLEKYRTKYNEARLEIEKGFKNNDKFSQEVRQNKHIKLAFEGLLTLPVELEKLKKLDTGIMSESWKIEHDSKIEYLTKKINSHKEYLEKYV